MKTKLPSNYELSGPFFNYASPYGKVYFNSNEWFLTRHNIPKSELKGKNKELADHYFKYGKCIGRVKRFGNQPRRYILPQTHPIIEFKSLQKALNYLIENEGKIVYLS